MDELISKEVVIDTLKAVRDLVWEVDIPSPTVPEYIEHHEQMQSIMRNIDILTDKIIKMPFVQPESAELSGKVWDEWCTGCKEYDQERHCCPRFNRIIRSAIDDAQPEIVKCKDCKYYQTEQCYMHIERLLELTPDDFCSQGERGDLISRQAVRYKLIALVNEFEEILSNIREREVDDSVCGLCEYDGACVGESGDWCNECPGFDKDDCFKLKDKYRKEWLNIDE